MSRPHLSIVIPIYNEEGILHSAVVDLRERIGAYAEGYEIVLAENGSKDRTVEVAQELARKYPEVVLIQSAEPNYGLALQQGIRAARGDFVICDEIDLCDVDFHREALALLESFEADLVIGSKLIQGAADRRPLFRHAASIVYTTMLKALLDFRGSDTHGLKAFRRERLLAVLDACQTDKDVFASEFVIRAYRAGISVREIPIRVVEKRPPSINLLRRVPNVLKNLGKLTWAVRVGRG